VIVLSGQIMARVMILDAQSLLLMKSELQSITSLTSLTPKI
jgi:hypothetical protein